MVDRKREAVGPGIDVGRIVKRVHEGLESIRPSGTGAPRLAGLHNRTCSICFESKIPADFPASKDLPTACAHSLDICRACITKSITDDLAYKSRDSIGCPECGARWDEYFLKLYAEPEAFAVFEALDVLKVLEAMPEFRRCLRTGCNGGQLHEAGDAAPIVTCVDCGYKTCFTHRLAWHTGLTCADFDISEETENETKERVKREEKEMRQTVRPCPRCNVDIEKVGGCDHMYCTRCYTYFSWYHQK